MSTDADLKLSNLKLIVGLGNPGNEYKKTRHNAGFIFVEYLATQFRSQGWQESSKFHATTTEITVDGSKIILAKPTTFMNASGKAVNAIAKYFKIATPEILIAHDDMDIRLADFKAQFAKGPKLHNGIRSINDTVGSDYWRLRIGIENRPQLGNNAIPGMEYALQNFTTQELSALTNSFDEVLHKIA